MDITGVLTLTVGMTLESAVADTVRVVQESLRTAEQRALQVPSEPAWGRWTVRVVGPFEDRAATSWTAHWWVGVSREGDRDTVPAALAAAVLHTQLLSAFRV